LNVLATCALRGGRLAEARDHFQKALDVSTGEAHANTLAATLDHLALVEKGLGHYDEALRLGLQALAQHRRRGAVAAEALCLSNLGSLHLARREHAAAAEYLKEALAICEREGIVGTLQYVLSNLTEVTLHLGDLAAAEKHARRTLDTALATDHRALVGSARFNLARLALRRGDLDAARAALAAGVDTVLPIGIPILKFDALACFAEILQGQGERACARQILAYATRHPAATPGVRAELQRLLDEAPAGDVADGPAPVIELDDLLRRIAAESSRAWAPLLGALRSPG
jgi:tetratricopeptide (TPR) repeat protein